MLQSYARLRQDIILAVGHMDDDMVRLRRREAFLDESQAGLLLATIHQLRANKEELLRRNQAFQTAAATHSNEELARGQAAIMAAEDRAADAEQQLNDTQERIAQLTAQGCELENQCPQLQAQPQAPVAVMQRLAAAEGKVRELQGQLFTETSSSF